MSGVDGQGLLLALVIGLACVVSGLVGLCLHDALHVSGPSVGRGHEGGGRLVQLHRDFGLFDLVDESVVLEPFAQLFVLGVHLFLVVRIVRKVDTLLGHVLESLAIEFRKGWNTN